MEAKDEETGGLYIYIIIYSYLVPLLELHRAVFLEVGVHLEGVPVRRE